MKKLHLIILLMVATTGYIYSQSCSSCRVSSFNYLKYGELDKAKETNDFCITCEKSKTDPRVWYYRGQIFQSIHTSKEFKKLDPKAAENAFEAYKSALLYNFLDPNLQKLDIVKNPADQMKFFTALNDQKTKYVDSEMLMDILMNQFPSLANIFVNKGVEEYQTNKNYEKAYEYFQNSLFVSGMSMRIDTPVIYYAALAAQKANKIDDAEQMFKVLTKLEYGKDGKEKAGNYYLLAEIYQSKNDTAKYIETLKKGIDKYPNANTSLVVELINHYLTSNTSDFEITYTNITKANSTETGHNTWEKIVNFKKGDVVNLNVQLKKGSDLKLQIYIKDKMVKEASATGPNCTATATATLDADAKVRYVVTTPAFNILDEKNKKNALDYLELATKNNPENSTYWFAKGTLYDGMRDSLKTVECYKKAIELDPKYFDANYNLGAVYFNTGAEVMAKANALPASEEAAYEKLKTEADARFKQALPYLEKAHELNKLDLPTLESLKNIYYRLGMLEQMEVIKKELDALKK